jgi:hypothetical protein
MQEALKVAHVNSYSMWNLKLKLSPLFACFGVKLILCKIYLDKHKKGCTFKGCVYLQFFLFLKSSTWSIKTKLRAGSLRVTFINIITKTGVTWSNLESLVTLTFVSNFFVVAHVRARVGVLTLVDIARALVRIVPTIVLTVAEAVPLNAHPIFTGEKSWTFFIVASGQEWSVVGWKWMNEVYLVAVAVGAWNKKEDFFNSGCQMCKNHILFNGWMSNCLNVQRKRTTFCGAIANICFVISVSDNIQQN